MAVPGGPELAIIVFVLLLFFGGKKLPELAGSIGRSIQELRRTARDQTDPASENKEEDMSAARAPDQRAS